MPHWQPVLCTCCQSHQVTTRGCSRNPPWYELPEFRVAARKGKDSSRIFRELLDGHQQFETMYRVDSFPHPAPGLCRRCWGCPAGQNNKRHLVLSFMSFMSFSSDTRGFDKDTFSLSNVFMSFPAAGLRT